jgi:hypothetical protein
MVSMFTESATMTHQQQARRDSAICSFKNQISIPQRRLPAEEGDE